MSNKVLMQNEIKEKFLGTLQSTGKENISGNLYLDTILDEVIKEIAHLIGEVRTLEERLNGEGFLTFTDIMDLGILTNHQIEQTVKNLRRNASYLVGVVHTLPVVEKANVNSTTST